MTKKLIALDLDGTVLRSDNTISDFTVDTIKKVQEKGHHVIIATGRPYRMALPFYKRLQLTTPMISFNGALTQLPDKKWEWEHSRTIDKHYLLKLLDMKKDIQADFIASEYKKTFYLSINNPGSVNPELFGVSSITNEMTMDVNKITSNPNALLLQTRSNDKYALADSLRDYFQNGIEVDSWGGPLNILECSPKGVNKAYALNYLLKIFNKTPKDLIAFGDEHNDTEMISLAGTGYAMKNAKSILLPYSNKQTQYTNEEDGVARQLQADFL